MKLLSGAQDARYLLHCLMLAVHMMHTNASCHAPMHIANALFPISITQSTTRHGLAIPQQVYWLAQSGVVDAIFS